MFVISAGSAFLRPWESIVVGAVSSVIVNETAPLLDYFHVDDPVGAVAVHGVGGILGMLAVGLFVEADPLLNMTGGLNGVFKGGGFYFLMIQLFSCLCTALWSMTTTFILLQVSIVFLKSLTRQNGNYEEFRKMLVLLEIRADRVRQYERTLSPLLGRLETLVPPSVFFLARSLWKMPILWCKL